MSDHTPGPWEQSHRKKDTGMHSTDVYDQNGETIATVAWYPVRLPNGDTVTARADNARLIAAAPDLLGALRQIADHDDECECTHTDSNCCVVVDVFCPHCIAQVAIAKAEGK